MPIKDHKTDPRILRTHRLLRDALFSLLYDNSFDSITIQDITERATLNRGTFYLHYSSKANLLDQSIGDIFNELAQSLKKTVPEDSRTSFDEKYLVELFEILFSHVSKHFSIYKFMLVSQDIAQFRPRLLNVLKILIYQDPPLKYRIDHDREVPGEMIVNYEASALVGIITWWLEHDMQHSIRVMASKMAHIAMVGPFNTMEIHQSDVCT